MCQQRNISCLPNFTSVVGDVVEDSEQPRHPEDLKACTSLQLASVLYDLVYDVTDLTNLRSLLHLPSGTY